MTLHVAQGMDVLERCMGHEQAQRAVGYIVSQGNLQALWDGGATVFFRRMLALSSVDIKLSFYIALALECLMGSLLLQSGGVHFHFIFYSFPKMCDFALILIEVWGWQATGNPIRLKIPSE